MNAPNRLYLRDGQWTGSYLTPREAVEVYWSPKFRIVQVGKFLYTGRTTGKSATFVSRVRNPGELLIMELLDRLKGPPLVWGIP